MSGINQKLNDTNNYKQRPGINNCLISLVQQVIAESPLSLSFISKKKRRSCLFSPRRLSASILQILSALSVIDITQTQIFISNLQSALFGLESGESKTEIKTGALCCIVASRPLVTTKSQPHSTRDIPSSSQDDVLQWRTNLSFSPAGYARDGMEHDMSDDDSHSFGLYSSRKSKTLESCFQLSPRWDSNSSASAEVEQKTFVANSIPSSNPQCLNEEKGIDRESTAISLSISSLLSLSEPKDPWETSSNQPSRLTHSSYPRVFCNPVSDCENPKLDHTQKDSSTDPDSSFTTSTRNHQCSPVEEASPDPSNSTSSNGDMLLDVERTSETEVGNQRFEPGSMAQQRCGVCKKLLSQKSPWCSYKMLRCGDMPAAGVFPCHHVYHVECLDKVTPTAQTREPACPVCSNTIGAMEQPLIMAETLQQALRSLRRSHTALGSEPLSSSANDNQTRQTRRRSHKWGKISCCLNISFPPFS